MWEMISFGNTLSVRCPLYIQMDVSVRLLNSLIRTVGLETSSPADHSK
jgi:hypothetical protein